MSGRGSKNSGGDALLDRLRHVVINVFIARHGRDSEALERRLADLEELDEIGLLLLAVCSVEPGEDPLSFAPPS